MTKPGTRARWSCHDAAILLAVGAAYYIVQEPFVGYGLPGEGYRSPVAAIPSTLFFREKSGRDMLHEIRLYRLRGPAADPVKP